MNRRLVSAVALAWLLVAAGPAGAHGARLSPSSPVTAGSGYVALGDSVTFGYQEPAVVPAPAYRIPASFHGYPEQLGTALHLRVTNFACPGETSASLIDPAAPSFGCETGYRRAYPLHVRYTGSQLAAAVSYLRGHRDVRLVSLMIGANDLFRCQATTANGCRSPAERGQTLNRVAANIRHILTQVRGRGGYTGQIVIVNYFSLDYATPAVSAVSRALDLTQDRAARPFHVRIADGYGEFALASVRFANNPCLAGLLTQVGTYGQCGVHPSYAGQTLLAQAVTGALDL